jgi:hypothetical protein
MLSEVFWAMVAAGSIHMPISRPIKTPKRWEWVFMKILLVFDIRLPTRRIRVSHSATIER